MSAEQNLWLQGNSGLSCCVFYNKILYSTRLLWRHAPYRLVSVPFPMT